MSAAAMAACCCSGFHRPTIFIGPFLPRQLESSSCRRRSRHEILQISAIFWKPIEENYRENCFKPFIRHMYAYQEAMSSNKNSSQQISLSVVSSILDIKSEDWDTCASDANGRGKFDPFTSHAFFSSLEESGSAVQGAEWWWRGNSACNVAVCLLVKEAVMDVFRFEEVVNLKLLLIRELSKLETWSFLYQLFNR